MSLETPLTSVRVLTFEDHRRTVEGLKAVYPVLSRRARGVSLGINLNPDKACNFDCIYCQVDRTVPGPVGVDLDLIEQELAVLLQWIVDRTLFEFPPFDTVDPALQRVNDLCFAGDGEPTSFPRFHEAVQRVVALKHRFGLPEVKVVLITNASLLHRPGVQAGLALMDEADGEVWAKLDAGTEAYYQEVCDTRVPFRKILDNIRQCARQRPIVIQSLFLETEAGGPPEGEILAYIQRLQDILAAGGRLKGIQVYTVARRPPLPRIYALPDADLERIADLIRKTIPIPVETFPGSRRWMRNAPPEQPPSDPFSF